MQYKPWNQGCDKISYYNKSIPYLFQKIHYNQADVTIG